MDKQKALKKIAKCLELGNSANINEAANAIKMAHNLMLKYGLDKDDIEFIKWQDTVDPFASGCHFFWDFASDPRHQYPIRCGSRIAQP